MGDTGDGGFSGAPSLFGFGIGFPEVYTDPEGYSDALCLWLSLGLSASARV